MEGASSEMGGGRRKTDDLNGLPPIDVRIVTQLPEPIATPAEDGPLADPTGVFTTGHDSRDRTAHQHGLETIQCAAVTELTIAVQAPAERVPVR